MDHLWSALQALLYRQYYYQKYSVSSKRCHNVIKCLCAVASSSLAFMILGNPGLTTVGGIIILALQLVALIELYFPFSDRVLAAEQIHKRISRLVLEAEPQWYECFYGVSEITDADRTRAAFAYLRQCDEIEYEFASAGLFPPRPRIQAWAEKQTEQYLRRYFQNGKDDA